jgi:hypothetical protein
MRGICKAVFLLGLFGLSIQVLQAQAIAESAVLNSHSSITAQSTKPRSFPTATPTKQSKSPYITEHPGPSKAEVNRKDFEDNAGEKAAKMLLRSVPSGASIFINGLSVGQTPLLMVIAPGKYKVDMVGPRQQSGHSTVGIMPKETQTVLINLKERYPTSVLIR